MLKLLFFWVFTSCFFASVIQVNGQREDYGYPFFCIVISNQSVSCWGDNTFGQLGNGNNHVQNSPVLVKDLFNIVKVSVGDFHTCAINSTGSIWCWGRNTIGLLGIGNTNDQNSPVLIESLHNIVDISVGRYSSCAIDKSGNGWLWGTTYMKNNSINFPMHFKELSNVLEFSVGYYHICMLKKDGFVYCWGDNNVGQLGTNLSLSTPLQAKVPTHVEELSNIVEIRSYYGQTCARNTTGSLFCWGDTFFHVALQNVNVTAVNSTFNIKTIVEISVSNHNIIEMSASFNKIHFLTKDGQVLFLKWNISADDQLELQTFEYGLFLNPVKFSNVVKIYSGPDILCAINTTGSVSCSGPPLLNQPLTAWVSKESPTMEPTTEPTTTSGKETMIIIIVSVVSGIIILIAGFLICRRLKSTILPHRLFNV